VVPLTFCWNLLVNSLSDRRDGSTMRFPQAATHQGQEWV